MRKDDEFDRTLIVSEATEDLERARQAYLDACDVTMKARLAETAALNRLNQTQREFDSATVAIRKHAGIRDSDWANFDRHRTQPTSPEDEIERAGRGG
jgi:hypothetical protein